MKLRKALDKAKEARMQESPSVEESAAASTQSTSRIPEGFASPVYSESTSVRLDTTRLKENKCVCIVPGAPNIEPYKVLRTQIQQRAKERGWNAIMITSVLPDEGKTLTAVNLALTLSKEFSQTVLLVDADLKQQNIHKHLCYESHCGLVDHLMDNVPLKDLIVWPGVDKLTIISGGKTVEDSAEVLNSPRMHELVHEMKNRYPDRFILFDAPSILGSADALAFAPLVDGIVIVVEAGKTQLPDIKAAIKIIPEEKLLGLVLNKSG